MMHNAFPLVNHNGTAAKVKTSRGMKTDLFVWGRPDEGANGQPIVRVRGRAVDDIEALEEERGDVRIDLSLSMKKRVMHSENK